MTTTRTSSVRRSLSLGRGALVALVAGTGLILTPLPATAAVGGGAPAAAAPAAPVVAPNHAAQAIVNTAMAQRGKAYVWAGAGPNVFDCSGLTQFAAKAAGVKLPHSSRMQSAIGTPVSRAALQPGDLVFFYRPVSHVGIYIGGGKMVHAPTRGDVVKVTSIDAMRGFSGARRLA